MRQSKQQIKGVYKVRLNLKLEDFYCNADIAPISAIRKEIVVMDSIEPVKVDAMRVAPVFQNLRAKDFKYYFYVLGLLEANDRPITINMQVMRVLMSDKWLTDVAKGLTRLVAAGLLFKMEGKKQTYIVNPVYAWKGDRLQYFNTDDLPLIRD